FENSNWTWDPVAEQYYWHRFFHHQPDLNYDNPLVQEEVLRIIDYWCKMGVDGFRLDAVPYLYEREGTNGENLPETHAFLQKLRAYVDQYYPGTVFLAEANMWPEDSASYFGNGDECHMNYHFPVMPRMFMALQMEDRYPITDIFDQTPDIPSTCQWAIFLRNHDELTLEMVTDEERDYMYKVYARDPKAKINLGIRHRLAPLLDNSRNKIELLNSLLFSLPGTPVIYYGDEIGMGDNFYLGDRDGVRTPMQWSPDRNAGFSMANPQKLYLPLILDPEYHYESVNVETQRSNTSSLLWYMKRIIGVRKKFKTFGWGNLKFLNVENPKVLAFTRTYEDETLLIVANLSKFSQAAEIDLSAYKGYVPVDVFSKNRFPVVKDTGDYFFTLAPYSFQWFLLEKAHPEMDEGGPLPGLILRQWEGLMEGAALRQLESNILPRYLQKVKWFTGKDRSLFQTTIVDYMQAPLNGPAVFWLLLEIAEQNGTTGFYQLPVMFVHKEQADKLATSCPESLIARVRSEEGEGALIDAFFVPEWQTELFQRMTVHKSIGATGQRIEFTGNGNLKHHLQEKETIVPRLHTSDLYNTSITYNGSFFLKMYRRVDATINPDLEITRFLTKEMKFPHIPAFVGDIEWKNKKGLFVLGLMQEMIENHGDGYGFFQERIHNYIERLLAGGRQLNLWEQRMGTLMDPVAFEALPLELQTLLGAHASEQARLIGIRTAELHLALASGGDNKDFRPEPFSLHYQRGLFSSLQSLVRETYQILSRNKNKLPADMQGNMERIIAYRPKLLAIFKRIYAAKLDALKIRIHGNYHLGQVLLTGKDIALSDYSGDPALSYSERRLKRSPLVDLATMVLSFHKVAFEGFMNDPQLQEADRMALQPFAAGWAHYMSGFFIKAYTGMVKEAHLLPVDQKDFEMMWQNYLLQKAILAFNDALRNDPARLIIPLTLIRNILREEPPAISSALPKGAAAQLTQ
ncbi:MAG TPA: alpha-amylase family glycosyl hydrolase, partial [Puia sp.]|nr:alpha-amylase family glycosyl hydrolase [Puia sp.]